MRGGASEVFEIGKIKIISSREGSDPGSTWSEDLCLMRVSDTKFDLFVGGYEVIAEVSDFFDEETGEEEVPEEIDGYPVQGIEDGYVGGGEILKNEDDGEIQFSDFETIEVKEWLESINWGDPDTVSAIQVALKSGGRRISD